MFLHGYLSHAIFCFQEVLMRSSAVEELFTDILSVA